MRKNCKQFVDKKHNMCAVMSLEDAGSSDASSNNTEIANKGIIKTTNEKISFKGLYTQTLFRYDEGQTAIARKNMMH